ncbi:MAG TPA: IS110 family transposase [Terriglobales bacterium]|nr:IS110 family transposase [Terriglobales bacterium]
MNPAAGCTAYAAVIGLDWADQKHDVCLWAPGAVQPERTVLTHRAEAIAAWVGQLQQRFGGRPVAVALEQSRGGLMAALMAHEFLVLYPINPGALAKYRRSFVTSRAKDDPTDAELLAELIIKHPEKFRPWRPDTAATRQLAALVEARRHAVNLRTRLSHALRSSLKGYFPQALELVGEDLFTPLACDFLAKWPSLPALKRVRTETLRRFYTAHNSRRHDVIGQRLKAIAAMQPLTTDEAIVTPSVLTVQLLVAQLRSLSAGITRYEQQIAAVFAAHEDASIFASFPGAGPTFAPRLLAAFGSDRSRFASVENLQQYSGIAPVTERSGNRCWVHWRWACPKFLRQSFHEYANESIRHSLWARAYYRQQIQKGSSHAAATRALAFKWQRILWRCWQDRTPYNEAYYLTMLQKRGSKLLKLIAEPVEQTT